MDIQRKDSRGSGIQPFQLVTPQEPTDKETQNNNHSNHSLSAMNSINRKRAHGSLSHILSTNTNEDKHNRNNKEHLINEEDIGRRLFHPSLENTRELENEMAILIQRLNRRQRTNKNNSSNKKNNVNNNSVDYINDATIIDVLNKSLMALSHWTLQGQLLQMSGTQRNDSIIEPNISIGTLTPASPKHTINNINHNNYNNNNNKFNTNVTPGQSSSPRNQPQIDISPKTAVIQKNGPQRVIRFGKIRKPRQPKIPTITPVASSNIATTSNNPLEKQQQTLKKPLQAVVAATYIASPTNKERSLSENSMNNKNTNRKNVTSTTITATTTGQGVYKFADVERTPLRKSTGTTTPVTRTPITTTHKPLHHHHINSTTETEPNKEYIRVFQLKK